MPDAIFSFFGLAENPFKISPDPRFLFVTEKARSIGEELAYAIRTRKGLILLTGEVGTGKTLLLRRLLNWLAERKMPTALIFNSHIKPEQLLDFILHDFGIACESRLKSEKLIALNRWLLEQYRAGQTPVLIVDEAQGLDLQTLEEIRLLLNFETPREKLLQIVLAGQPELEAKLKRHELRQLRQRITIRCRTEPLTQEETGGYIQERLRVAGSASAGIFDSGAVASVHAYSHGIPRVINVLCEHSLINSCADGDRTISHGAIEQAAHECQLDRAESVARILQTGSYSQSALSEIGSLLETISARPMPPVVSPRTPVTPFQRENVASRTFPPQANPTALRTFANFPPVTPTAVPDPEQVKVAGAPELRMPDEQRAAKPEVATEHSFVETPKANVAPQPVRTAAPPHRSLAYLLQSWGRSFRADVRSTSRQARRFLRSLEKRHVRPSLNAAGHEFNRLASQARRFSSDPRWRTVHGRGASAVRWIWIASRSALPSWLTNWLGIQEVRSETPEHERRPPRRRTISSLKRWLHEPINDQRKLPHRGASRRRSFN
jgi:general secretion pathway protein A